MDAYKQNNLIKNDFGCKDNKKLNKCYFLNSLNIFYVN